jgi:hypothetical protein
MTLSSGSCESGQSTRLPLGALTPECSRSIKWSGELLEALYSRSLAWLLACSFGDPE